MSTRMPCPVCEDPAVWVWIVPSDSAKKDGHKGPYKLDSEVRSDRVCWWWMDSLSANQRAEFDGYCPIPACDYHVKLGADALKMALGQRHFYWQYH